jgi:hypothetical protein
VRVVPRLCELYPGFCLTTEGKARKTLSEGRRKVSRYPVGSSPVHIYTQIVHRTTQTVHRTTQTVHRTTQTVHRTTQNVHRTTQTVHIHTQTVHRTTQTVHRTTQTVHRTTHTIIKLFELCLTFLLLYYSYEQFCNALNYYSLQNWLQLCWYSQIRPALTVKFFNLIYRFSVCLCVCVCVCVWTSLCADMSPRFLLSWLIGKVVWGVTLGWVLINWLHIPLSYATGSWMLL